MKEESFKLKRREPTREAKLAESFGPARSVNDFFDKKVDREVFKKVLVRDSKPTKIRTFSKAFNLLKEKISKTS